MQEFELLNCIHNLGYTITRREESCVFMKKRDDDNIADSVLVVDLAYETIGGWIMTLVPIRKIDEIAHQYKIYREMRADLGAVRKELHLKEIIV